MPQPKPCSASRAPDIESPRSSEGSMSDSSEATPVFRGKPHDGDVLGPRGEVVHGPGAKVVPSRPAAHGAPDFAPPVSAIGPLFRYRLERIYRCRVAFDVDIN